MRLAILRLRALPFARSGPPPHASGCDPSSDLERRLRGAGVASGLRVLDIGCGACDVLMLVGELVGPTGFIVGIDRSAQALATACESAERALRQHHLPAASRAVLRAVS